MAVVATMLAALFTTCESGMLGEIRQVSQAAQAAGETRYYTVTYDGNAATGGEVPVDPTRYEQGQTVTVLGNTGGLEKEGFNFFGWNTASDGRGTNYGAGEGFQMGTANVTLYARWTQRDVYTVTFQSEGGSHVPEQPVMDGDPVAEPFPPPSRTGYTFGGWYKEQSCINPWDFSEDVVTQDRFLWAKWTANEYTVTFDRQGGTGGPDSVTATFDSHMPSQDPDSNNLTPPSRTGYTFGGYFTEIGGNGTRYYSEHMDSVRLWDRAADTTLYAKWTANTYTVTFDRNGGIWGTGSVIVTFGSPMPAVVPPLQNGMQFVGYYTIVSFGFPRQYYTAEGKSARDWDIAGDRTLRAHWIEPYQPGDTGPAGGIVFYDKGHYSDGWRWLEAAPASTEWTGKVWAEPGTTIGATGTAIGTGATNTQAIVDALQTGDYAAILCAELVVENPPWPSTTTVWYDDWFLPSIEEIFLMHTELRMKGIGGLEYGPYWSSSEIGADLAWIIYMGSGNQFDDWKTSENRVRAIRAF